MANTIKFKRGSGSDPGTSDLSVGEIAIRTDTAKLFTKNDAGSVVSVSGGVEDGDKGDITVSSSGSVFTIDNDAVTYAKIQNVSATDRLLGRDSSGAGIIEEIAPSAVRTMLGLAASATTDTTNASNISSGTLAAARVATLNQDTSGTAAIATTVTVADESSDTSCNVLFATAATGNLAPKSGTNLTFNSSSGVLTATGFAGALTGNVTGNASGSSGSCTGNAATATALETARTIAGVSFDGSANISLNNNAITNGAGYITSADGGNAATLDGIDSTSFLRSDAADIKTAGHLTFNDNIKSKFGTGGDTEIYFDGSNGYIDQIAGDLYIRATGTDGDILMQVVDDFIVKTNNGGTNSIRAYTDAGVELYFDGTKRFETSNTGTSVTGNIVVSGTVDGRDLATDGSKLDGIEAGATTDQTKADIDALNINADQVDGLEAGSFIRSDADDTASGIITLSSTSQDCLNFSGNATNDRRGIAFNGRIAVSADYNDGYLRFNDASEFGNGVYTPTVMRADGGFSVGGTNVINSSAQVVASRISGALPAIDGSALTGIAAGATGGGSDEIFWENGQSVTSNYTITNGKNAMSAGPITIDSGVTVTVGSGETWTVV